MVTTYTPVVYTRYIPPYRRGAFDIIRRAEDFHGFTPQTHNILFKCLIKQLLTAGVTGFCIARSTNDYRVTYVFYRLANERRGFKRSPRQFIFSNILLGKYKCLIISTYIVGSIASEVVCDILLI